MAKSEYAEESTDNYEAGNEQYNRVDYDVGHSQLEQVQIEQSKAILTFENKAKDDYKTKDYKMKDYKMKDYKAKDNKSWGIQMRRKSLLIGFMTMLMMLIFGIGMPISNAAEICAQCGSSNATVKYRSTGNTYHEEYVDCRACGYQLVIGTLRHSTYDCDDLGDGANHRVECKCGYIIASSQAHSYSSWAPISSTQCQAICEKAGCGYIKTENHTFSNGLCTKCGFSQSGITVISTSSPQYLSVKNTTSSALEVDITMIAVLTDASRNARRLQFKDTVPANSVRTYVRLVDNDNGKSTLVLLYKDTGNSSASGCLAIVARSSSSSTSWQISTKTYTVNIPTTPTVFDSWQNCSSVSSTATITHTVTESSSRSYLLYSGNGSNNDFFFKGLRGTNAGVSKVTSTSALTTSNVYPSTVSGATYSNGYVQISYEKPYVDETAPIWSAFSPTGTTYTNNLNQSVTVQVITSDQSGIGSVYLNAYYGPYSSQYSTKTATAGSNNVYSATYTLNEIKNSVTGATNNGEGTYTFDGRTNDTLGNGEWIGSGVYILDLTPPVISSLTASSSTYTGGSITLTAKTADALSGIVSYGFSDSSSTPSTWTSVNATTAQITPTYSVTNPGTYYFWVTDRAGNVSSKSVTISSASISGSVTITGTNKVGQTLTANTSNISPTGCSLSYQWYSNSSNSTSGGSAISGATGSSYTIASSLEGKYIYVVVSASKTNYNSNTFRDITDASSNGTARVDANDKTPPTASWADASTVYTNGASHSVSIVASDDGSGIKNYTYQLWYGSTIVETITSTSSSYTASLTKGEGTYGIVGSVTDNAGNTATIATTKTIVYDKTAPSVSFSPTSNSTAAKSHSTTVTVTDANGINSAKYVWTTSSTAPTSANSFTTSFSSGNSIATPSGVTGTYYLHVYAVDGLGNARTSSSQGFIVDNTAPAGTIKINGGATYTTSTGVTLAISATSSDVVSMAISNTTTQPSFENYATSKSWTLTSGDASKVVYIWFRDSAGNVSAMSSASIILDTTEPEYGTMNVDSVTTNSISVTVVGASDATSGIKEYDYHIGGEIYTLHKPASETYKGTSQGDVSGLKPNTQYSLTYYMRDNAGHLRGPSSAVLKYTLAAIPSNVTASVGTSDSSIAVSWSANGNPSGTTYTLEYYGSSGAWATLYSGTATSYTHTGLAINNAIQYRVKATNGEGVATNYSAIATGKTTQEVISDSIILDTTAPDANFTINTVDGVNRSITVGIVESYEIAALKYKWTTSATALTAESQFTDGTFQPGDEIKPAESFVTGTYYLQVYTRDVAGNSKIEVSPAYSHIGPVSDPSIVINNGATYTNSTSVTLTLGAKNAAYMYFSEVALANADLPTTGWSTYATTATFNMSEANGEKTIYAYFKDVYGNIASSSDSILLDSIGPIVETSLLAPTITNQKTITVQVKVRDELSGALLASIGGFYQGTNNGAYRTIKVDSEGSDGVYTATFNIDEIVNQDTNVASGLEGIYIFDTGISDVADNWTYHYFGEVIYDVTAPTIGSISAAQTVSVANGGHAVIEASDFADNLAGVDYCTWQYKLADGSWSVAEVGTISNNGSSYNVPVTSEGTYTVRVNLYDKAGNSSYKDTTVIVDRSAPAWGTLGLTATTNSITATVTGVSDSTQVAGYKFYILDEGKWILKADQTSNTYTFTTLETAALQCATGYYVAYEIYDIAGNTTGMSSEVLKYTLAQVPTGLTASDELYPGTIDITWATNGNPSEVTYELVYSDDNSTWNEALYTGTHTGDDFKVEHTGLAVGTTKYYKVRAKNQEGVYTEYTAVETGSTSNDTEKPVVEIVGIYNNTLQKEIVAKSTDEVLVTIRITDGTYQGHSFVASDVIIYVDGQAITTTNSNLQTIAETANSEEITVLVTGITGDGQISVGVPAGKVTDLGGNTNDGVITATNMNADNTKPTITSNQSTEDWTNEPVEVTIITQDNLGLDTATLNGNEVTVMDGTLIYTTTHNATVNNEVITFEVADEALNTNSTQITVDNIDLVAPKDVTLTTTTGESNSHTLTATAKDDLSGIVGYLFTTSTETPRYFNEINATTETFTQVLTVTENATYYFWVIDQAGNTAISNSATVSGVVGAVSEVSMTDRTVQVGNSVSAAATLNGTAQSLVYASSDTSIATVDSNTGMVTGVIGGEVTITATATNYDGTKVSGSCTVTVTKIPSILTVTPSEIEFTYGIPSTETISYSYTGDTGVTVTATSSNENVIKQVTDEETGETSWEVQGAGEATITYTAPATDRYAEATATSKVTVHKGTITPTVSMRGYTYGGTISSPSVSIEALAHGGTATYYYNTSNSNVGGTAWTNVTSPTYLNAGTYYMYAVIAESDNYNSVTTDAVAFTIAKATPPLTVEPSSVSIFEGKSTTVTVTYNGDGQVESAVSDDTSIATATLASNVITINAVKDGNTFITVSASEGTNYNAKTATINVEILAANYTDGTNLYVTLKDAFDNATSGKTIKALRNVEDASEAVVASGKSFVLDTNGYTITKTNTSIVNNGTLEIKGTGTVVTGEGEATGESGSGSTSGTLLADVVEIGDYVNYGVEYENVEDEWGYISALEGWRVIGIDGDTVKLVSAGTPLTYYYPGETEAGIVAANQLVNNFLDIPIVTEKNRGFIKSGFNSSKTLKEIFRENKFIALNGEKPIARSMKNEDILGATGYTDMFEVEKNGFEDFKYNNLFVNGTTYWLASSYDANTDYLWLVNNEGLVNGNNFREYGVRPVVTLKPTVLTTGQDSTGAWNLTLDPTSTGSSTTLDTLITNNGTLTVSGSTLKSSGVAINSTTANLTIGTQGSDVNTSTPVIQGATYAIDSSSGFKFYDGILKGASTEATVPYTTADANITKESGYNIKLGTQTIDSTEYKTAILAREITDADVSISPTSYTYDGTAKEPTITVTWLGAPLTTAATLTKGSDYTVTFENNTNPGTAKVTIKGAGSYIGEVVKEFTISKNTITIKANAQTITYGENIATGTSQVTATGLSAGHTLSSITLTPSTSDATDNGTITPSDAVIKSGSTDVTANYTITYETGKLVINAKEVTRPAVTGSYTYNGAQQTVTLSVFDSNLMTVSGNTGTDADTYTATVSLKDKTNYVWDNGSTADLSLSWTIDKKDATITANAQEITYGESIATGTSNVITTGIIEGHTLSAITLTPSTTSATANGTITASAATIKAGTDSSAEDVTANYDITYKTGKLTINKATPTLTLNPTSAGVAYGSTGSFKATASQAGTITVTSGNTTYITIKTGNGASVTAGTATTIEYNCIQTLTSDVNITVTFTPSDSSYETVSATYTAQPADKLTPNVTLSAESGSVTYGSENSFTVSANVAGSIAVTSSDLTYVSITEGDGADIAANGSATVEYSGVAATTTAKTITVVFTPSDTTNYNTVTKYYTVTEVAKKALTVTANAQEITYGGSIATGIANVTVDGLLNGHTLTEITLTPSTSTATTSGEITPSAATIKAGTSDVTANYAVVYVAGALTINKQQVTIPTITGDYVYNGAQQTANLSYWDSTTMAVNNNTRTNAGTQTVTVSLQNRDNYEWTDGSTAALSLNWTIAKKAATVTASAQEITYGNSIATGTGYATASGLVSGHTLSAITLTPSTTNVTDNGTITPSAATIKSGTTDVTENYEIVYETGKLIINEKAAELYLDSTNGDVNYDSTSTFTVTSNVAGTIEVTSSNTTYVTIEDINIGDTENLYATIIYKGVKATEEDVIITVTFTPTSSNYSGSTKTYTVTAVNKIATNVTVSITGTTKVGETLTANATTVSDGEKTYQWWSADSVNATTGELINGATGSTYTVTDAMSGKYVGVTVSVATGTNYLACTGNANVAIEVANYSVNGKYFETLEAAYNSIAETTGTIEVVRSNTDSSALTIGSEKSIIIDTNGLTITKATTSIVNDGTLEITGEGKIETASGIANNTLIVNNGTLKVPNSTLESHGVAIESTTANLTIGTQGSDVSTNSPVIQGATYAIDSEAGFNFYDGILKGAESEATVPYTTADANITKEAGYGIRLGTETINGTEYTTATLALHEAVGVPTITTVPANTTNWLNTNITFTLVASTTEPIGGQKLQYKLSSNGNWTDYTGTVTVSTNGETTIYARAVNATEPTNTSLMSAEVTQLVKIDKAAPTGVTLVATTGAANSHTITGKGTDSVSGIVAYAFTTSANAPTDADWTPITTTTEEITQTKEVTTNSEYYFWVKDQAGNTTVSSKVTVSGIVGSVTNITISGPTIVQIGNSIGLTTEVDGTAKSIVFTSENTGVATVNSSTGAVTGVSAGTAVIKATATNYDGTTVEATHTVTVIKRTPTLTVTPSEIEFTYGVASSETISSTYTGDSGVTVTATSDNETVIKEADDSTTSNIKWTVVGAGEATITYNAPETDTYYSATATVKVIVHKGTITPSVIMSGYTYGGTIATPYVLGNTAKGTETYYYNTSASNSGGTEWTNVTSSTYLNADTYYMYAVIDETDNYNGATTDAVAFTISKATPTLTVNPSSVTIFEGKSTTVTVTYDGDGDLSVTPNDESIATATISSNTVTVNGVKDGQATITVNASEGTNYNAKTATIIVEVLPANYTDDTNLYVTLKDAFDNATSGKTIKVLRNVEDASEATVASGKSFVLDTNGFTVTKKNYSITNNGTLEIKGTGTIEIGENINSVSTQLLTDVVAIGDYVNYGVEYENVEDVYGNISTLTGWRVIGVENNKVKLISAGAPLAYWHNAFVSNSIANLVDNFLTTEFYKEGSTVSEKYVANGFDSSKSLTQIFKENKYTALDGETPIVRSIKQEDIFEVTGHTSISSGTGMDLGNEKYNNLFVIGEYYWIASKYLSYDYNVTCVSNTGNVSGNDEIEYGVRPIVYLDTAVLTTGKDSNNVWQLTLDANVTLEALITNNGTLTVSGSTLKSTGVAIESTTANLTIGAQGNDVNTTTPIIQGATYAIDSTAGFKFYDGILKGASEAATVPYTTADANITKESGYNIKLDSETIDSTEYTTAILAREITDADVSITPTSYTYDGTAKEPTITVTWLGTPLTATETLTQGTDYTVAFVGNTTPGTATVTIKGAGSYIGEVVKEFTIAKRDVSITAKDQSITFGDNIATGISNVTVDGLASGHTLSEITLTPSTTNATDNGNITPSAPKIIDANGNEVTANYNITLNTGKLVISQMAAELTLTPESGSVDYNSTNSFTATTSVAGTIEVTSGNTTCVTIVSGNGASLTANTPSTITYKGAKATLEATTITVKFTPSSANYSGVTKTYTVNAVNKIDAGLSASPDNITLIVGNKGTITLTYNGDGALDVSSSATGVATESVASKTITVAAVAKGSATITVDLAEGTNHLADTLEIPVTVNAKDLNSGDIETLLNGSVNRVSYDYDGKAKEPTVTITDTTRDITLNQGTDYTIKYENNTNAGTATVTITGTGNYTGTITLTFDINAVAPTITLTDKTETYTGSAIEIDTATVLGVIGGTAPTGAVTYTYYTDSDCTESTTSANSGAASNGAAPVNNGTYYVKATIAAAENYLAATSEKATLVINKAPVTLTLTPTSGNGTYNSENSFTATASVAGTIEVTSGNTTFITIVSGNGASLTANTASTITYKCVQTLSEDLDIRVKFTPSNNNFEEAEATYTVHPAGKLNPTLTLTQVSGEVDYNSTNTFDVNADIAGTIEVTSGSISHVEIVSGNGASLTANVASKVTYKGAQATENETVITVKFTPTDTTNYNTVQATYTVNKVNKIAPSLSADPASLSLTVGNNATTTISYDGDGKLTVTSSKEAVATVSLVDNVATVSSKANGKATLTIDAAEGINYIAASITVEVTVNTKDLNSSDIEVLLNGSLDKVEYDYDGTAKEPTVTITDTTRNITLKEDVDYTVEYKDNTNAGEATVTITGIGDYTGTLTYTFTINKVTPTIELENKEATYTGNAIAIDAATVTGVASGTAPSGAVTYTYYVDSVCTTLTTSANSGAASNGAAPVYGGIYYVKATIAADDNYFAATSEKVTLTINGAAIKPTVSMSGYEYATDSLPQPKVSGNTGNGSVKYYYSTSNVTTGGTEWTSATTSTTLPADTYYMYAVVDATTNYGGATTAAVEFVVTQATPAFNIDSTNGSITYGSENSFVASSNVAGTLEVTSSDSKYVSITQGNGADIAANGETTIKYYGATATTAAVTITIVFTPEDTTNYKQVTKTYTVIEVDTKAVTITANAQQITYGESIETGTDKVTVSGLLNGHVLTAITLTPSTTNATTNGTITPSAATIMSGTDANAVEVTSNYTITYAKGDLTVGKKQVTIPSIAGNYIYNGAEQTAKLSYWDSMTMSVSNNLRTNAGTQTVTVSLQDIANYEWTDGSTAPIGLSWTISKATASLEVSDVSVKAGETIEVTYKYNGDATTASATSDATDKVVVESVNATSKKIVIRGAATGEAEITLITGSGTNYNAATETFKVTVTDSLISGVTNPNNVTVKHGTQASFTVSANGSNLKYQWYKATSASAEGTAIDGAASATYTIAANDVVKGLNGTYYYCVVSNTTGEVASGRGLLTVFYEPEIGTVANQTVAAKQSATFSVVATDGNPLPTTYKWQVSTDNGASWSDISGATSSSYTIASAAYSMNGYKYRVLVGNSQYENAVESNVATLTVNKINISTASGITAEIVPITFEYDGTAKEPKATVKYNNYTLVLNTDYTVVYDNNIQIGEETATATITGKGDFEGTIVKKFSIVDTGKPTNPTIVAKLGDYDGDEYVEGTRTNKNIAIELISTDADGVATYEWSTSIDSGFTAQGISLTDEKGYIRFETEMNQTIYFRAKDHNGNYSEVSSIEIIIDKTAPTGRININADYIRDEDKYVNDNTLEIDITTTDNMSETENIMISLINETEYDLTASNDSIVWMNYEETKYWESSPGDGLKTIYVIFKDEAGNQSVYLKLVE